MELYQEVQENVAAQNRADAKTAELFAFFDEVCSVLQQWQCYRLSVLTSTASLAVAFTGLRQVEGTSFGGYASLDAVDCRDSERCQTFAMMREWDAVYFAKSGSSYLIYFCFMPIFRWTAEAKAMHSFISVHSKIVLYDEHRLGKIP